ncbi:hypothetical protein [Burkholderia cenocepacia]|jgi:hypothetical protein|nr:hypothetical protein [Burkholderia cenocepacia]MDN7658476.1 hypothetical protein [Burkholderia cenocepacia]
MSRFTDHAERFEIHHPRAARVLALAIFAAVALLAYAADSITKALGIQ